jgi:hypothetical protein
VSTILKALQRLENDKAPKPEMTLDDQIIGGGGPSPPPKRGWLGLVSGVLAGVGVAAALIYFWPSGEEATPIEVAVAEVPAPAATQPATGQVPSGMRGADSGAAVSDLRRAALPREAAPVPSEMLGPEFAQEVEVVERIARRRLPAMLADEDPIEPEPRELARTNTRPGARPERDAAPLPAVAKRNAKQRQDDEAIARRVAEAKAERVVAKPSPPRPGALQPKPESKPKARTAAKPKPVEPAVTPAPVQVAAAQPTAKPRPKPAQPKAQPAPAVEPSSQAPPKPSASGGAQAETKPPRSTTKVLRRAAVPDLRVRRTVWHPDASRRLAVVELVDEAQTLELREGDAVGPLVIDTIKPTGVQFAHDGVAIHRAISND